MKYFLVLATILFASNSVQAQTNVWEKYNLTPTVRWETNYLNEEKNLSFSKEKRIQIGIKFSQAWEQMYNQEFSEKIFGDEANGEQMLLLMVHLGYMNYDVDNEKGILLLINDLRNGDKNSANLLGILMYLTGREMLNSRNRGDQHSGENRRLAKRQLI